MGMFCPIKLKMSTQMQVRKFDYILILKTLEIKQSLTDYFKYFLFFVSFIHLHLFQQK